MMRGEGGVLIFVRVFAEALGVHHLSLRLLPLTQALSKPKLFACLQQQQLSQPQQRPQNLQAQLLSKQLLVLEGVLARVDRTL